MEEEWRQEGGEGGRGEYYRKTAGLREIISSTFTLPDGNLHSKMSITEPSKVQAKHLLKKESNFTGQAPLLQKREDWKETGDGGKPILALSNPYCC